LILAKIQILYRINGVSLLKIPRQMKKIYDSLLFIFEVLIDSFLGTPGAGLDKVTLKTTGLLTCALHSGHKGSIAVDSAWLVRLLRGCYIKSVFLFGLNLNKNNLCNEL
jgi:hypothetical protein